MPVFPAKTLTSLQLFCTTSTNPKLWQRRYGAIADAMEEFHKVNAPPEEVKTERARDANDQARQTRHTVSQI